jgi:hypothetical protein
MGERASRPAVVRPRVLCGWCGRAVSLRTSRETGGQYVRRHKPRAKRSERQGAPWCRGSDQLIRDDQVAARVAVARALSGQTAAGG